MARKTLTDNGVAALKPKEKPYTFPDPQCVGHYVRVTPTGNKSFRAVARDPNGKQRWVTIGNTTHLTIDAARNRAREIILSVKGGKDHTGPKSFESVTEDWLRRHVEAQGLITEPAIRGNLKNHILPSWSGRNFESITRKDVADLLNAILHTTTVG